MNPCPRVDICNDCEQINLSGDISNAGGNVEEQDDYGFTGSFFKKHPIILDDSIKNKLMNVKRTPMLNIDKQQLNLSLSYWPPFSPILSISR